MIESTTVKLFAALALVGALFAGAIWLDGNGYARARGEDALVIQKLKTDAATQLATETEKTRTAEQALQAALNTQNLKDADHETTVSDLSERLRHLADPAGRLRDPHATAGCRPSGGGTQSATPTATADRPADATEAGGLLSKELSELLPKLQREGDEINNAYISCRADAYTVRSPH